MIVTVWQLLRWLFRREEYDADDDEDGSAYSLLDASVLFANGHPTGAAAVQELQKANERAAELESARERDR